MPLIWNHKTGRIGPAKLVVAERSAMVMTLTDYEHLVNEFTNTFPESDRDYLLRKLFLGELLIWLRQREMKEADTK